MAQRCVYHESSEWSVRNIFLILLLLFIYIITVQQCMFCISVDWTSNADHSCKSVLSFQWIGQTQLELIHVSLDRSLTESSEVVQSVIVKQNRMKWIFTYKLYSCACEYVIVWPSRLFSNENMHYIYIFDHLAAFCHFRVDEYFDSDTRNILYATVHMWILGQSHATRFISLVHTVLLHILP